ncbi:MAG: hypothetical protein ABIO05_02755, partial [Ferruginibacter sp.]
MEVKRKIFLLLVGLSLCIHLLQAQRVIVSVNRNEILIGQQINYGLKITLPGTGLKANFTIPDSIQHFDIIRKGALTKVKNESALEQVIVFTSFDSGQWYFPAIPVLVTDGRGKATLYSDSFLVKVGYSPADSSGQLRDIKPVMDVHIPDYTLYYILAGLLLLALLAWLFYRWYKKRKNRPVPVLNSNLTPYNEAMQALDKLSNSNYLNTHNEKIYHTELADIFKRYLS